MKHKKLFSTFFLKDKNASLNCEKAIQAFCYFKNTKLNLLTGDRSVSSIMELKAELSNKKVNIQYERANVIHLFYELGYEFNKLKHLLEEISEETPLAILIEYDAVSVNELPKSISMNFPKLRELNNFSYHTYSEQFDYVYKNLLLGNCYQVNLTHRYRYSMHELPIFKGFSEKLWAMKPNDSAQFAHSTYSEVLGRYYLSNTPECLFEIKEDGQSFCIETRPIKGTVKLDDFENEEAAWDYLSNDPKNESELNMITDLMRNDLTRINMNPSRVISKKLKLKVPGILHQYSVIASKLNSDTSLLDIVSKLFPGGSITGAPKISVMKIIKNIENSNRGFYCGSTILLYKDHRSASINIRSSEFNDKNSSLIYGSGGGVTLKSKNCLEFEETEIKKESFLSFLRGTK